MGRGAVRLGYVSCGSSDRGWSSLPVGRRSILPLRRRLSGSRALSRSYTLVCGDSRASRHRCKVIRCERDYAWEAWSLSLLCLLIYTDEFLMNLRKREYRFAREREIIALYML